MKNSVHDNGGFIGRVADYAATDYYQIISSYSAYSFSSDSITFGVSSQEGATEDIFFKPDGTVLFMIGKASDKVHSYTLSTAWDLSTASYTGNSLDVKAQTNIPTGVTFKPDGTKLYVSGQMTNSLSQYSLSTAWDITTASLDSDTNGVFSEEGSARGVTFKPDGTKFYIVGPSGYVHEYSMTTAWDISTNSFSGDEVSLNGEVGGTYNTVTDIAFNSNGTIMYAVGLGNYFGSWDLSTAYDITTASFNSKFSVPSSTQGITFKDDYTKVYFIDSDNNVVSQYSASSTTVTGVYYDLSNATYDNVSSSAITEDAALQDLSFSSDGTKMYICGRNNDTVYQYTLSTAWNVSTALYANKSYYIGGQEGSLSDIFFKADGSKFYIIGYVSDQVHQYSLSTAWDISTASYDNLEFSVSSQEDNPRGLTFKPDGTKMFVIGQTADAIQEYALSTAWNVSSASHTSTFSTSSQLTNNQALFFAPDGYKVWATGADDVIYQYILTTAWDISTASYDSVSFSVLSQSTQTLGIEFNTDGTKLYALDNTLNIVYQYSTGYTTNKKNSGVWSMDADYLNAEVTPQGYRYIKWHITDIRSMSASMTQISELYLKSNGSNISWGSATITNPGGNNPSSEQPSKLIDGIETNKVLDFNVDVDGGSIFIIDAGVGNLFNFDSYYYVTANDSSSRDPISWTIEGSNDGTNYTVLHTVTNATITGDRRADTQTFTL